MRNCVTVCVCACVVIPLGVAGISVLSLLQNFESVFGLQINLSKSGLTGIKVEDQFLDDLASGSLCNFGVAFILFGCSFGWKL